LNNITRVLSIFSFTLILSVILFSCCTERILITEGGNLYMASQLTAPDVVNEPFSLINEFEIEYVNQEHKNFGLINSAWASSCDLNYENEIDRTSLELTLDKDFVLDNETFVAGTNLLTLDQFTRDISGAFVNMYIDPQFFTDAIFDTGDHTFTFSADIEGGLSVESSLTLNLNF